MLENIEIEYRLLSYKKSVTKYSRNCDVPRNRLCKGPKLRKTNKCFEAWSKFVEKARNFGLKSDFDFFSNLHHYFKLDNYLAYSSLFQSLFQCVGWKRHVNVSHQKSITKSLGQVPPFDTKTFFCLTEVSNVIYRDKMHAYDIPLTPDKGAPGNTLIANFKENRNILSARTVFKIRTALKWLLNKCSLTRNAGVGKFKPLGLSC